MEACPLQELVRSVIFTSLIFGKYLHSPSSFPKRINDSSSRTGILNPEVMRIRNADNLIFTLLLLSHNGFGN